MSENSKIEWTDHTFNPWEGCTKVGAGCDHCYAEVRNARYAGGQSINWGSGVPRRRTSEANWKLPIKWNKEADAFFAEHGRRQRVFCASLADVFDNEVDPKWRADLIRLISDTPNLDWLLLTKRIGNVMPMMREIINIRDPLPSNVWLGATIVNQQEADRDIPKLLTMPASVRFLSMEPLLGSVDISHYLKNGRWHEDGSTTYSGIIDGKRVDWVIVGGESGSGSRPMHPDWARSLRDQCVAANVPYLFKQWGEWLPDNQNSEVEPPHDKNGAIRIGKKAAGRLLDGVTHDGYPKVKK